MAPGVPFQSESVQKAIHALRNELHVQVYDCQSSEEAFDALSHFWPDCLVLDGNIAQDTLALDSLLKRSAELGGEDQPMVYILNNEAFTLWQMPHVCVIPPAQLQPDLLLDKFLLDARPRLRSKISIKPRPQDFEYEWMGKTTRTHTDVVSTFSADDRFRSLVNNSYDLVSVLEPDGFIKYVSAAAHPILGIWPEDLAGKYLQDFLVKCKRNNVMRWLAQAKINTGYTEVVVAHADGHEITLEVSCADMTDDAAIKAFVLYARDVTKRRQAEAQLSYQARLLGNIKEAVVGLNAQGKVIYLNKAAERFYKVSSSQALGLIWGQLCKTEWLHPDEEVFAQESLREHTVWQGEVLQILTTGRRIQVEISITAYNEGPDETQSQILVVRDVKDRKLVESVLHESETKYQSLVSITTDLIWHTDGIGVVTFISPTVQDILGYPASEVQGRSLTEFLAEKKYVKSTISLSDTLHNHETFSYLQATFLAKNGQVKYLELSGLPFFSAKEKLLGYHGTIRDVTHRVESERAMRKSLAEKETLLKEIHHRVKNNMQIVTSLLHLQSQFITDPDLLARLKESQDRIQAMALVHEKIYQSKDLHRIDFKDYIETLARHISNSYRSSLIRLHLIMPEEQVYVAIDTAIPSGLVLNELVSNAYKHAFVDGEPGAIWVRLTEQDGAATLIVQDNGRGLVNTDIETYTSSSLGMQLVDALVHQLHGKLSIVNDAGAVFSLTFNL